MSLIDVLNEDGTKTGKELSKDEIHKGGFWHRAAHCWIYNSKGEMLFQLRAKDKDSYPGLLDISAAGHVDAGESPEDSMIREIKEEIGLDVNINELITLGERRVSKYIPEIQWQNNEINSVFLYKYDGDISKLEFPDREVESLEWVSINQLKSDLLDTEEAKRYVDHGDYYKFVIHEVEQRLK